jgi:hypothetical protein
MIHALALFFAAATGRENETTLYFNQTLDHFNAETKGVWKQRYYVNTTYFKKPSPSQSPPPLFFIPGGEWSLGPTKGILYGMAHDLAEQHGGLMATAEHRFYGESLPFGPNESFVASPDRIGLLSIEQSMADYSLIIKSILKEYGIVGAPVVALGGSYSGKLSAYMRLKYPFLISIALASSAPIYLDSVGMTDQYAYYEVVERATAKISPKCPAAVKAAFTAYAATPSTARQEALGLCKPIPAAEFGWDELEFYIVQYFATMAMFNYPPSSSNLAKACDHVLGSTAAASTFDENTAANPLIGFKRLLAALRRPANATCFDLDYWAPGKVPKGNGFEGSTGSVACSDWSGCGPSISWDYQACTQVTQPLGIRANSTMFLEHPWSEAWMTEHCMRRFGVQPSFEHLRDTMGLDDIARWPQPSRIIFSNGLQDPWHAGGVLKNITETMVAITIENGAHHQDLNGGASSSDTPDMLDARAQERKIIAEWLKEANEER